MGTTAGYPLGAHLDAVAVRDLALGFYAVGRHGAAELRQLPESDGSVTHQPNVGAIEKYMLTP